MENFARADLICDKVDAWHDRPGVFDPRRAAVSACCQPHQISERRLTLGICISRDHEFRGGGIGSIRTQAVTGAVLGNA